jgi:hypothetical protein
MARPLADVVLAEELDERVEVVRVERGAHLLEEWDHFGTSARARISSITWLFASA